MASNSHDPGAIMPEPASVEEATEILLDICGKLGHRPDYVTEDLAAIPRTEKYVDRMQQALRRESEKLVQM